MKKIITAITVLGISLGAYIISGRNYATRTFAQSDNVELENLVIKDISAGTNHNLALDQNGQIWAWGNNDHGQLGDGTTNNSNVPIPIMKGHRFKKISAGNDCSAAIDVDGYLYGWGDSINPCLASKNIPTKVSNTDKYKDVHCSFDFTTTILSTDTSPDFYFGYGCFKQNVTVTRNYNHPTIIYLSSYRFPNSITNDNVYININKKIVSADGSFNTTDEGDNYQSFYWDYFIIDKDGGLTYEHSHGSTGAHKTYSKNMMFFKDIDLASMSDKKTCDVAVRKERLETTSMFNTAYFVIDNGDVYSVGYNGSNSYFGNNDITTVSRTTPVKNNSLTNIKSISAGAYHVLALDQNGRVFSWGLNGYGQLGIGNYDSKTTPTVISSLAEKKCFNITAFAGENNNLSISQYGGSAYTITKNPEKGSISINSSTGEGVYTPNNNASGYDVATVSINYSGNILSYDINFFIDNKPVFIGGTPILNVECGESVSGSAPASDKDGDNIVYSIYQNPSKGTVVLTDNYGSFTYTANNDVAGGDSFIIAVSDGYCSVQYVISVHIHSLITFSDETDIELDLSATNSYSSNVNAVDIDGDTLSYSVLSNGSKGNVVIDSDGNYTYTASGVFFGEDSFTIRVDDDYVPLDIVYTVHLFSVTDDGTILARKITKGDICYGEIKTNAKGATPHYSIFEQASNGLASIDENTGEYTYIPNENSVGDDSFTVLVDYSYGQYTITIHIYQNTIPNDENVIASFTTNVNTNYLGTAECVDIDGDGLSYSINTNPEKGSLSLNQTTGEFTYYPNENVAGDDSFKIDVYDGTDHLIITFLVHIESQIEVEDIFETISQNTSLSRNINAIDKDSDALVYSLETSPEHGVASVDSLTGDLIYIPVTNYYGDDSFIVKVDDGVLAKLCTVNMKINRAPITDKLTINITTQGVAAHGTAQCSDPDGDALTYSLLLEPSMGIVTLDSSNGSFAYTPFLDAAGDDTFKIQASDGYDNIIITVNVHNETDVQLDEQETTLIVNQGKTTNGQILAIDLDRDPLTYTIVSSPVSGTLKLNENTGAWAYTTNDDAKGTDSFSVKISDGRSETTISYNLIINTPASFEEDSYKVTTNQNNEFIGYVSAVDGDGDSLTFSIVSQGNKGTATINPTTGKYLYSPNEGAAGNDMFVVGVSDGNYVTEVEIEIHIETDIVISSSTVSLDVDKDGIIVGNVNATDLDGDALEYSVYQQGEKGNVVVMGDGSYSYFANEGAGDDVFVISVSDGVHTKYVTFNVHISSTPLVESTSITIVVPKNGSFNGQINASDEDGDELLFEVVEQPTNGIVQLNSSKGTFVYTPFNNAKSTNDSFVVSVTDGTYSQNVTINVVFNNPPKAENIEIHIIQGGSGTGEIKGVDGEKDSLIYSIKEQGVFGKATINSQKGTFTYVPNEKSFYGTDSFVVSVSDGLSTTDVIVSVRVDKNSKPKGNGLHLEVDAGKSVVGQMTITDLEDDPILYSISSQGDKGTAFINEETGEFTYSAYKNTEGYDCFVITIDDGYNTVSYLVEVDIHYVDPDIPWALPTTIATGSVAALSLGAILFVLIKFRKAIFIK